MKPRLWIPIAAGIVIIAVAAVLLRPHASKDPGAAPAVRTGKAEVGDVRVLLNETGAVEPVRTVVVKSPISGTVRRLLVDEGDTVRVGQALAVIEPDLSQARSVTELRAAYGSARVTLAQKERDVLKARSLADGHLISDTDLANYEAEYERAQLDLKSMEEQLRALEQAGVAAQTPAQSVTVNAFTEEGAGSANLRIGEQKRTSLVTTLGLRASGTFGMFSPYARVTYNKENRNDDRFITASPAALATINAYQLPAYTQDDTWGTAVIGVRGNVSPDVSLGLSYYTVFSMSNIKQQALTGSVVVGF